MRRGVIEITLMIIFSVIIIVLITLGIWLNYGNEKDRVIHIKSVTNMSGKNVRYRVFTNEGVFTNKDLLFIGKFNSSGLQNEIMGKKECKIHTLGYRVPFLSNYPNITKIYWCK